LKNGKSERNITLFKKLITKKTMTTNTKENRFLKFMLLKIIGKIDKFILKLKKLNNNDAEILERLLNFKKEIKIAKYQVRSFIILLFIFLLMQELSLNCVLKLKRNLGSS